MNNEQNNTTDFYADYDFPCDNCKVDFEYGKDNCRSCGHDLNSYNECQVRSEIQVYNIDYSGEDFCGEISSEEAARIISEQPTDIIIDSSFFCSYVSSETDLDDEMIVEIVRDYFYEEGYLTPTSFDYEICGG
jgi:hypothetical protein